jgi:HEAT repeat protein
MEPADQSNHSHRLEFFKAGSTFISSVVIAVAGIIVTSNYNSKQIELQRQRSENELQLTQLREISSIIPKLGSEHEKDRRFAAIALGLHGPAALPALNAILADTSWSVREASIRSIELIGDTAVPMLIRTFRDERNDINQRAAALWALGRMPSSDSGYTIAMAAMVSPEEDPDVRKDAATVLGMIKNAAALATLRQTLGRSQAGDTLLTRNILWALGQIPDARTTADIGGLLYHRAASVRIQAIWSLAYVNPQEALRLLPDIAGADPDQVIRREATYALERARRMSAQ